MAWLRRNTTTTIRFGPLVAASDGYTYLATTVSLSASWIIAHKADGTVTGLPPGTLAMPRPGWLLLPVAASDVTSPGRITYTMGQASPSGLNLPVWREFMVVSEVPYDSLIDGSDFLQVDVVQVTGSAPSSAAIGSVANLTTGVNVTSMNGAAVSNQQVNANVNAINGGAPTNITFNANVLTITGATPSAAFAEYVIPVNVQTITGAAPSAAFAGYVIPVNVIQITGAAPSAAFAGYVIPVNVQTITGAAPSTVLANHVWSKVLSTPGVQSIEAADYMRVIGAAVAGRCTGATGAAMVFHGPSGEARVSGTLASGNRAGVTWVTGP